MTKKEQVIAKNQARIDECNKQLSMAQADLNKLQSEINRLTQMRLEMAYKITRLKASIESAENAIKEWSED